MDFNQIRDFLELKTELYNKPVFIERDPIAIPHQFSLKQDIEIMGFWASMLAWGQRKTIINKCNDLVMRMDGEPYEFIKNHGPNDLKNLLGFKHRTFNDTDTLYFVEFFKQHYALHDSLETAFSKDLALPASVFRREFLDDQFSNPGDVRMSSSPCLAIELGEDARHDAAEKALNNFRTYFFSLPDYPTRTKKHISSPSQKSACKRLNMFLRWMIRNDNKGVDFGIWTFLSPAELICPTDVHVERVARNLGLIIRKQVDWQTAVELTNNLRAMDPKDPVKYDFALFGLGIEEEFQKNRL